MNNKIKTGIYLLAFVLLLVGAYFAYHLLSVQYKPQNKVAAALSSTAESKNSSAESFASDSIVSSESPAKAIAPDFIVYDAAGNSVKLSDFKGKPVVLNFWASWCPPCKGEMPDFNEVYAKEKGKVQFLMINMTDGQQETQKTASNFVKSKGFSFPIYFDSEQQAADVYGISAIPATWFISKDGIVLNSYEGAIDKDTLTKEIEAIK